MDNDRTHRSLTPTPTSKSLDLEVIGEDRYHWILTNENAGIKLEWAKSHAPHAIGMGSRLQLNVETPEEKKNKQMQNLRQLLQELIA